MIPKKLHYIWFGGSPLSPLAKNCMDSWARACPDYEIVRWDESNVDVHSNRYLEEAIEAKKWAFASDYVRLWVLANVGGIYLDTDVELLKPLDPFLSEEAFSGFESETQIPTGLMGSVANQDFIVRLLNDYDHRSFVKEDGSFDLTTNVTSITNIALDEGLIPNNMKQTIAGFTLYPKDFFCPKDGVTREITLTENTYAIHHFDGSWLPPSKRFRQSVKESIGPEAVKAIRKLLGRQ